MEKRIDWIDFAKGFTILFVVLHHSLFAVNFKMTTFSFNLIINHLLGMVIAMFIMPAFFAISGYLYKKIITLKNYIFMIYKKFISLFIPYFIFNILFLVIDNKLTSKQVIKVLFVPNQHTWFLYALFVIFIIWGFMDLLKINIFNKFIVVIFLFMISDFIGSFTGMFSGIHLTFIFIPYFFIGNTLRNCININEFFKNKYTIVILTITSLAVFEKIHHFSTFNANMASIPTLVPRILLIILLFKYFKIFPKNKLRGIIESTGKYSIVIYLVHYFFVGIICKSLLSYMGTNDLTALIAIIISFVVSYGISLFIAWLCRYKIVRWIFFPRPFIDPLVKKNKFGKWIFSES